MNSTSLEKTQRPVSGFCYARNRVCDAVSYQTVLTESNIFHASGSEYKKGNEPNPSMSKKSITWNMPKEERVRDLKG